jgi:hypothetical protein
VLEHCTRGCTTKCCSGGDFGPIFREEQVFACLYRHECCTTTVCLATVCRRYRLQVRCKGYSPRNVLACEYDQSKDSNLTITLHYGVHEDVSCVQACSSQKSRLLQTALHSQP